jgi:hypothetical protein
MTYWSSRKCLNVIPTTMTSSRTSWMVYQPNTTQVETYEPLTGEDCEKILWKMFARYYVVSTSSPKRGQFLRYLNGSGKFSPYSTPTKREDPDPLRACGVPETSGEAGPKNVSEVVRPMLWWVWSVASRVGTISLASSISLVFHSYTFLWPYVIFA